MQDFKNSTIRRVGPPAGVMRLYKVSSHLTICEPCLTDVMTVFPDRLYVLATRPLLHCYGHQPLG